MKKKICIIFIAVLVAVLGASTYFIIDHYKEANKQAELYGELATLSTCEYSRNNSRLVVMGKRLTEDSGADAAKTHAEAATESERPN